MTFKIRQTLKYIDYVTHNVNATDGRDFQNLTEDYIKYEPKNLQILEGLNTIHKEQVSMPPSFFDIRIELSKSDGAVIYFDKMSSGERQFLFYMSTILYHVRNLDSVVDDVESVHYNYVNIVLEEVELYFHPEYQRQFIDKLINYLKKSQFNRIKHFNIIVVTHSPFILSDIPQDNVLFLRDGKNDNEVCDFKTFGANIHDLLRTSFFLENGLVGEFANNKIEELLTLLHAFPYVPFSFPVSLFLLIIFFMHEFEHRCPQWYFILVLLYISSLFFQKIPFRLKLPLFTGPRSAEPSFSSVLRSKIMLT